MPHQLADCRAEPPGSCGDQDDVVLLVVALLVMLEAPDIVLSDVVDVLSVVIVVLSAAVVSLVAAGLEQAAMPRDAIAAPVRASLRSVMEVMSGSL
jgi:hypothetical protein